MICPDCIAAKHRLHHGFRAGCHGCSARNAARSPPFHQSKVAGSLTADYLRLIGLYGVTHEQVKEASAADWLTKRTGT